MQMTSPLWKKQRGTKEPLEESEKAHLKLNIQKTKIMASGPIISWQINGKTMETVTADGDCSHEIKRILLLGRKAMINLDSILRSRTLFC